MECDRSLINELEKFIENCHKYDKLYIYGDAHNQQMLAKYLGICGFDVVAFVTSDTLCDYVFDENAAIILGLADKYYNEIYSLIANKNLIFLTERAKQEISYKVSLRKPYEYNIEINLVDHCNLNCQMCDHFAPLVKSPCFADIAVFERDLSRLSKLSGGRLGCIKLLGGEPLLNPNVISFLKIARKYFIDTPIWIYTNGLLLLKQDEDFWATCRNKNITIEVTLYPINIDINAIKHTASKYGVTIECFMCMGSRETKIKIKTSTKYKLTTIKNQQKYGFIDCFQMNNCNTLKDGEIYACPMCAYINYFNDYFDENFILSEGDYIDIYKIKSFEEIAEWASHPAPFCGHCDIKGRESFEWQQSKRTINEYL